MFDDAKNLRTFKRFSSFSFKIVKLYELLIYIVTAERKKEKKRKRKKRTDVKEKLKAEWERNCETSRINNLRTTEQFHR